MSRPLVSATVSVEMIPVHKISIITKSQSKARIFRIIKTNKILLGQHYDLWFKFRNVGDEDFPGGRARVDIVYKSKQGQSTEFQVDPIEKGKETPFVGPFSKAAMDTGYANFLGGIQAKDGKPVKLVREGQFIEPGASFHDIQVETLEDVYKLWALIATLASILLGILALLK